MAGEKELYADSKSVADYLKARAGTIANIAGTAGVGDDGPCRTKLNELITKLGAAGIITVT